jgi:glycerol kinase
MQFQAELLQTKVVRPGITETTALGAAYLAGLAVNYWGSIQEIKQQWQIDRTFYPQTKAIEAQELIKGWHRAIGASKVWADDILGK